MITEFASPERETVNKIQEQKYFFYNSTIKTLLNSSPDIIIIINKQRQIVFANENCLNFLNITDEENIIGKRPGEAIGCVNADKTECGCGTSKHCEKCGALQAILESQEKDARIVKDCMIKVDGNVETVNLRIWTHPLEISGDKFTILAIRDMSNEKHHQFLEKIFFYNIMNLSGGLYGIMELIPSMDHDSAGKFQSNGLKLTNQLICEIESQNFLYMAEKGDLQVDFHEINVPELLISICNLYKIYGAEYKKFIALPEINGDKIIKTDSVLLTKILGHLIKNALEASDEGQTVKVLYKKEKDELIFSVHNDTVMSEEVKRNIFNKFFSTKALPSLGLGTYSIKLLTEKYLSGTVEFTSEEGEGTTFVIKFKAWFTKYENTIF